MPENVTISHRGARYEIGRGQGFYGIWPAAAAAQTQPFEWWPETPEGWNGAWSRFTAIEVPATVVPAGQPSVPAGQPSAGQPAVRAARAGTPGIVAAALLAVGVACGIAGLFPEYLAGGASIAAQPAVLVPHAIYFAAWAASAALIVLGGARMRAGALLATGTSIVTLGLFFADAGTAIAAGGAHVMGAGLILGLGGWLACAAGGTLALVLQRADAPARPRGHEAILTLTLTALAALGVAIAFVPSWDSFTLRIATGATQSVTQGYAFANPGLVIAGDVAVMVALVAVAIAAAAWQPIRYGAVLLAGAIIPMAAQAISALVGAAHATSPLQFGVTPAQAAQLGLTISSGVTPAFWIYCAFVAALLLMCARMVLTPAPTPRPGPPAPPMAASPVPAPSAATVPAGSAPLDTEPSPTGHT